MSNFFARALAAALPLTLLAAPAFASGFALREASPGGVGRAFAGEGAIADSAATVWYNPAGMTKLEGFTATGGAHLLFVQSSQSDRGTTRSVPGLATAIATGGGDGGNPFHPVIIVPTLYASMQLTDRLWAGMGVNTPFGLVVDYDDGWFGRYDSTRSVVKTYNVQPSLAWKLDDRFSIGGGVSIQYIEADLNNALPNLSPLLADGSARVKGDDISFGWDIGGRFESGPIAVGLHYRSQVKHKLKGSFTVSGLLGPLAGSNGETDARAPITLPDSLAFSAAIRASERARILASAEWTNWSVFDAIRIETVDGVSISSSPQHYRDSMSFHLGGEYDVSDRWTVRTGVATDSTPTVDRYRTSRVPDGDRVWLTAGASWKLNDNIETRFSYAHVFVTTEALDREDDFYSGTPAAITSTLRSENRGSVNMVGADVTVRF
ncbi:long-chain fatty acid transporter [Sandaracinobacter neustonicus]|uniref:Long-chain fatty acid transporter n=1 Tax=Sandaracinobacter neustonicus TaxID=1715348 RepID=A0A501XMH4_9SPHN|nr:outer membrane protein transport protein [Sandaracinobacter neustonicus]TPE61790.1 long-chain fatty acid transporter [Sandaracinobacter neustonicus]